MGHFGMELQTIDPTLRIVPFHRCDRRIARMGDGSKSRRHAFDAIPVRHPHDGGVSLAAALEEITRLIDYQFGAAILALLGLDDVASRAVGDELHAIDDTKDWKALIEEFLRHGRSLLFVHAGRTAG